MNLSQEEIEAMLAGGSSSEPDGESDTAPEPDAEPEVITDIAPEQETEPGHETDSEADPETETLSEAVSAEESLIDAGALLSDYAENDDSIKGALTPEEIDTLGEVGNICMGAVATTMYMLLDRRVEITTPKVAVLTFNEVLARFPTPLVVVEVEYVEGISGRNLLVLEEKDAALITDVLMGGEGVVEEPIELSELHMSAINEIMNQMIGASATALSKIIGNTVNISTPISRRMTLDENEAMTLGSDDTVIEITFDMEIDGLLSSHLVQFMPYEQGRELAAMLINDNIAEPEPEPALMPAPVPELPPSPPQIEVQAQPSSTPAYVTPAAAPVSASLSYSHDSLHLIHDIPVHVSVELGRTKKEISEILDFDSGTVIVLDKTAGDPVEIFVNGKLVASGEVVVIDENYGVRITALYG